MQGAFFIDFEEKNMKRNNKGFSLVELIITIAIMAILIGMMAPLLLKFVEKSKVSSDIQLADTVRGCIEASVTDVRIIEDVPSQPYLDALENGGIDIDTTTAPPGCSSPLANSGCLLEENMKETLGMSLPMLINEVKSTHGGGTHFHVEIINNAVHVTLTQTDKTGGKDTAGDTPENDICSPQ